METIVVSKKNPTDKEGKGMCGYSQEEYKNRDAKEGEELVLHQFPSGSKGFVSPGDCETAVCIKPGTKLEITATSVGKLEKATFIQKDIPNSIYPYRDAVRFGDGEEIFLQNLPEGAVVHIIAVPAPKKDESQSTIPLPPVDLDDIGPVSDPAEEEELATVAI